MDWRDRDRLDDLSNKLDKRFDNLEARQDRRFDELKAEMQEGRAEERTFHFQGVLAGAVLLVVFQDWLLQPFRAHPLGFPRW